MIGPWEGGGKGGFYPPKMVFLGFLHSKIKLIKFYFLPLNSAQNNKQFSILDHCSTSNGYRDIDSGKQSTLSQC